MLIRVDPSSTVLLFEQLAESVRAQIVTRKLAAGDRLPAARELAESLEVNVHTVLRAYQQLRDEGLIDLRRGRGAVVTATASEHGDLPRLVPVLVAEAQRLGLDQSVLLSMIREEYKK